MHDSEGAPRSWRPLLKSLQRVFLLLAVVGIGVYLLANRDAVGTTFEKMDPRWLAPAAVWLGLLHPVMAYVYWCIQRGLGIERSYRRTLTSYIARLPARFVPGGVWHSLARYADIHNDDDASAAKLGGLFVLEVIAVASGGCLASGVLAWSIIDARQSVHPLALLVMAAGVAGSLVPFVLPRWRRHMRGASHWFAAIIAVGIVWTSVGATFALVAKAIGGPFLQCASSALSATYTTAATAGYAAIFAPQGWGVTDAVFALLRPCPIPLAALLSAILAYRLVTIVVDICIWAAGSMLARSRTD